MAPQSLSELIRRAEQAMADGYADAARGINITRPQLEVLRVLRKAPMIQCDIVKATSVDRSSLSELLERLVGWKVVTVIRTESDMRKTLVSLTPSGRVSLDMADAALRKVETSIITKVPASQRAQFLRNLIQVGA